MFQTESFTILDAALIFLIFFFWPPEGPISTVPNPDMPRSSSSVGWEADLSAPRMANLIELEIMPAHPCLAEEAELLQESSLVNQLV